MADQEKKIFLKARYLSECGAPKVIKLMVLGEVAHIPKTSVLAACKAKGIDPACVSEVFLVHGNNGTPILVDWDQS